MAQKSSSKSCILSKFYIKPQLLSLASYLFSVVSYRNSTSNHNTGLISGALGQVVSYRNSTSNHNRWRRRPPISLVVSYRNSTSNHNQEHLDIQYHYVVSYRNSTSNHNWDSSELHRRAVVSYRNSTSNHNCFSDVNCVIELYLIEILHQTTTRELLVLFPLGCILSKFYIKPQHPTILQFWRDVVSYRNSTSNHNYQFTSHNYPYVVSYRNSTSNHNYCGETYDLEELYLIEILHQTTTSGLILIDKVLLTGCLPL